MKTKNIYGVTVKQECHFAGDCMKRVGVKIADNAEGVGNLDHNTEPEQIWGKEMKLSSGYEANEAGSFP